MRQHAGKAALVAAVIAFAAACSDPATSGSGNGGTSVNIGIAVEKDAANMPFVIADEQGIYEECGLDAQVNYFQGGGELIPPLTVGEVDFGWVGTTAVLSGIEEGAPLKTIAEVN